MKRLLFTFVVLSTMGMGLHAQKYRNFNVFKETKLETNNDRIALVIANAEYDHGKLDKPVVEAEQMVEALVAQGFDVEVGYNLDHDTMEQTVINFARKYPSYKSGLVYYAGHGFQMEGENYLVPVDTPQSETAFELKTALVNVDFIFEAINDPAKPKLVIMDACRNNPFKDRLSSKFRSADQSGFSEIKHLLNSMMLFSTGPGTKISDDNPFTKILSEEIKKGGCFDDIVRRANGRIRKTNPTQMITIKGFLQEEYCFGQPKKKEEPVKPSPVVDKGEDKKGGNDAIQDKEALREALSWMQGKLKEISYYRYYDNGMLSRNYSRHSNYSMEYDVDACTVTITEVQKYVEDRSSTRNDTETTLTYEFNLGDIGSIEIEDKWDGKNYVIKGYNGQDVIKQTTSYSSTKTIKNEISLRFSRLGELEGAPERFVKAFTDAMSFCGAKKEKY